MSDDIGNPMEEGISDSMRRAAQLAAAAMAAVQLAIRVRTQREAGRQAADQRATAEARATHAEARLAWSPAFDAGFAEHATTAEAMAVWSAATPWRGEDDRARDAADRAEARLEVLHPEVMAEYRDYADAGLPRSEALLEAGRTVARPAWKDILDPRARQEMGVDETLRAWAAARPWAAAAPQPEGLWSPRSEEAALAVQEAEDQLRRLRPDAMADYDDARGRGVPAPAAMEPVLPQLREHVWQDEVAPPARLGPGHPGPSTARAGEPGGERAEAQARADRAYPEPVTAGLADGLRAARDPGRVGSVAAPTPHRTR